MTRGWLYVAAWIGGFLIALGLTGTIDRRQIAHLKAYSDSVAVAAAARDSAATAKARADSLTVDSLQSTKRVADVILRRSHATRDSLRAALAAGLGSAHDTIVNQAAQIVTQDAVIDNLVANAKVDSLSLWIAMRRGDALLDSLHAQTAALAGLNAQVQRLNQHALPKWLRVSFGVAEKGLAAKGLVDLVRGK